MKIMGFDEFVKMPSGTIFSYLIDDRNGRRLDGLCRKDDTIFDAEEGWARDFFEIELVPSFEFGQSIPNLDGVPSRWGALDYDQRFVVYEEADVKKLRSLIPGTRRRKPALTNSGSGAFPLPSPHG